VSDHVPLFVYGTLLSRGSAAPMLRDLRREPAIIRGELYHMPAGYPAVILRGGAPVYGELVYDIPPALLALLDHYEGVDEGLYARLTVRVELGLRQRPGFVYVMPDADRRAGRRLPHGRWRSPRGADAWTRSPH